MSLPYELSIRFDDEKNVEVEFTSEDSNPVRSDIYLDALLEGTVALITRMMKNPADRDTALRLFASEFISYGIN